MLLVIAIALAMPAGLYTAVENLRILGGGIELNARMTVFLKANTDDQDVANLMTELEQRQDVTAIAFLSPERALEEFRQESGFGDVLALLDNNPLPGALLVQPDSALIAEPAQAEVLVRWLQQQAVVDDVSVDLAWLQRLHGYLDLARQLALGLGVLLGAGVLLIMGNTIRLAIANRREEIVVVKLIGGTNGYVRRPFLYTGFWYGFWGGFLAWALVWLGYWAISAQVDQLAKLYQSSFSLLGPDWTVMAVLLIGGAVLGLAGAWLAVALHLRLIEPE
jgi:Cell division protein